MKAKLWEISVCSGILEMTHGWSQKVQEIEVPSVGISLNMGEDGESVNFFKTYKGRYAKGKLLRELEIPDEIAKSILSAIEQKSKIECEVKKLFDTLK